VSLVRFFVSASDIDVDGANNKWIGTADSGVYGFTKREETKYHFTESNSSPSNVINDIDITDRRSLHYQKQD
jgi:hypothetical protein